MCSKASFKPGLIYASKFKTDVRSAATNVESAIAANQNDARFYGIFRRQQTTTASALRIRDSLRHMEKTGLQRSGQHQGIAEFIEHHPLRWRSGKRCKHMRLGSALKHIPVHSRLTVNLQLETNDLSLGQEKDRHVVCNPVSRLTNENTNAKPGIYFSPSLPIP